MIRFACPSCSSTFTVSDEKAGKTSNCPKCKATFVIPGEGPPPLVPPPPPPPPKNAPITIDPCPKCRTQLSVEPADLGTKVECPTCRTVFKARKPGTGTKPSLPPPVTKTRVDDDDDEPVRRRSRDDDNDVDFDDDRPRRRPSSRRDDDDVDFDDDRPRRRSRRDDDFDDDDFDRPRRRPRRRSGSGTAEGQGVRVTSAVFGFIIGGLMLICSFGLLFCGGALLDAFAGIGRAAANAPPPAFATPGAPNNNAQAGAAIAGLGWLTGGVVIGCGLVGMITATVYIVGGIGLLQLRTYGKILTIIAAVFSIVSIIFGVYGFISTPAGATGQGVLMHIVSIAIYATHSVTSFMASFGTGSHRFN